MFTYPILGVATTSPLLDNLLAWYKLEETGEDDRIDSHLSHDLEYASGTTNGTAGHIGTCYDVTSGGGHSRITSSFAEIAANTDMSFSMWLFKATWADGDGVFSVYSSSGQKLITRNTDKLTWEVNLASVEVVMPTNQWFHIGLAFDKAAEEITIILNGGTPVVSAHTGGIGSNATNFRLGLFQNAAFYWMGKIDEFAVWNRVVTTDEFTELYNSGTGITYPE